MKTLKNGSEVSYLNPLNSKHWAYYHIFYCVAYLTGKWECGKT